MEKTLAYARKFYGCDSLPGIPLENNGGGGSAASHWEKQFMPKEVMNPSLEFPTSITMFSILFFTDTQWYKVRIYNFFTELIFTSSMKTTCQISSMIGVWKMDVIISVSVPTGKNHVPVRKVENILAVTITNPSLSVGLPLLSSSPQQFAIINQNQVVSHHVMY